MPGHPKPPDTPGAERRPYQLRQRPLIKLTGYLRVKGCRRLHRLRAKPRKANPKHPKRPRGGKGLEWLRAYLTAIARGPKSGRSRWVEIDLNRCFNARGYSLSWGRELWRRVQADGLFRALVKVRYVQKRFERDREQGRGGNGAFVILIALRRTLAYDREPLFRHHDDNPRHLRCKLRGEDIDEGDFSAPNPDSFSGTQKDCPVSSIILPKEAAALITRPPAAASSIDPAEAGSVERGLAAQVTQPQRFPELRNGLNKTAVSMPICKLSREGGRKIMKKAVWLAIEFKARHWENCKVAFRWDHAMSFGLSGLLDGQSQELLKLAWDTGIKLAHADAVDRFRTGHAKAMLPAIQRSVEALALYHSRRWLAERTSGRRDDRVRAVYGAIADRPKVEPTPRPDPDAGRKLWGEVLKTMEGDKPSAERVQGSGQPATQPAREAAEANQRLTWARKVKAPPPAKPATSAGVTLWALAAREAIEGASKSGGKGGSQKA